MLIFNTCVASFTIKIFIISSNRIMLRQLQAYLSAFSCDAFNNVELRLRRRKDSRPKLLVNMN